MAERQLLEVTGQAASPYEMLYAGLPDFRFWFARRVEFVTLLANPHIWVVPRELGQIPQVFVLAEKGN